MSTTTIDVVSIGRLACQMQVSIPRVRDALEQLDIAPAIRLNGIDHYPADVADRLYVLLGTEATS